MPSREACCHVEFSCFALPYRAFSTHTVAKWGYGGPLQGSHLFHTHFIGQNTILHSLSINNTFLIFCKQIVASYFASYPSFLEILRQVQSSQTGEKVIHSPTHSKCLRGRHWPFYLINYTLRICVEPMADSFCSAASESTRAQESTAFVGV